jgi:hypothetical protein
MFPLGVTNVLENLKNRYYGFLNDIIECDFNSFKLFFFDVKWYRL